MTPTAADMLLEQLRSAGTYIQLHVGPPGSSCKSNVAAETNRQRAVFQAPSDGAMRAGPVTWAAVAASETFTHFSVWTRDGHPLDDGVFDEPTGVNQGDDFTVDFVTWTLE